MYTYKNPFDNLFSRYATTYIYIIDYNSISYDNKNHIVDQEPSFDR